MSRITRYVLARAVTRIHAMDATQEERLADQLFRVQPHVFAPLRSRSFGGYPKSPADARLESAHLSA